MEQHFLQFVTLLYNPYTGILISEQIMQLRVFRMAEKIHPYTYTELKPTAYSRAEGENIMVITFDLLTCLSILLRTKMKRRKKHHLYQVYVMSIGLM